LNDRRRGSDSLVFDPWRHRFGCLTAAATVALIFVGGLVTSTGSGLSVPDWPLSYGMLMPPMVGGVRFEHSHRMVAGFVGLLTLALAVWTSRAEPRRGVRRLAWAALLAVAAQAVLGGLTVLYLLPTAVSVAHACLAQTFLCLAVAIAYATSREWLAAGSPALDEASLRRAAGVTALAVYAQLVLGAVLRHIDSGLAIPDLSLGFEGAAPAHAPTLVRLHLAHRLAGLAILGLSAWLLATARRSGDGRLVRHAAAVLGLAIAQAGLGAVTVLSGRAVLPSTAHVAFGAVLLAGSVLLLLRSHRLLRPRANAAATAAYGIGEAAPLTPAPRRGAVQIARPDSLRPSE
jgi:cytochrome c oxidase assembly protein subunit 15